VTRAPASPPPDQAARERVLRDLDATLLVEAAAGTGKTTGLVGRMVELVRSGRCAIDALAAVTFTRKAAAELRSRFSARLEEAARTASGPERERLAAALARGEACFIGTIHSFCARLLRERPIEAGVDVGFEELDEDADGLLREEAWEAFVAELFAADPPDARLERLDALGLEIGQLREAFLAFCDYPDVESWPAADTDLGDLAGERAALRAYLAHIRALHPFPEERGTDRLMDRYERIERLARQRDLSRDAPLMEVLELFAARHAATQKCWPGGAKQGKDECARWDAFSEETARPLLARWREKRYAAAIPLLQAAVAVYDRLRGERGVLTYQDLLLKAARLLRDRPKVRSYFRGRFTHLLVDEFQDTDPLQAEVALFLTASDPAERDWRRCRPVPGALFVVGDPKQSIYRFRRADIVTYQAVREIIAASGDVVTLEANFRTLPGLIAWGNGIFGPPVFPAAATAHAPAAHPLAAGRPEQEGGDLAGRWTLGVPEEAARGEEAAAHDAGRIARFIRHALDAGLTVPRPQGAPAACGPGDFLVVTWGRKRLDRYAAALQELGVPHQVTGGSAWRQVGELRLLAGCLRALVEPENPVALVAALRGGLFGFSDAELYAFRRAGGRLSFAARQPEPAGPDAGTARRFAAAFERLRRYAGWLDVLPPVAALERVAADHGLLLQALAAPGGDVRAGSVGKAFAILREAQRQLGSTAELAAFLEELIEEEKAFDGVPARAAGGAAVRVMNLHKVKGLEAPVVFLADPGGKAPRPPRLHVDRSGRGAAGYLVVTGAAAEGRTPPVLAQPRGWEGLAAEEGRFADAERNRLLYVAATRAGAMLVTTVRSRGRQWNPWEFFAPHLAGAAELPDPGGEGRRPAAAGAPVEDAEVEAATAAVQARWDASGAPTYAVRGAKEVALGAAQLHRAPSGEGEHGTAWGTVIHVLLETAMREPAAKLGELARSALAEQELDPALADEALATVAAVRASALWARAAAAERTLVEVPFEIVLAPGDALLAHLRGSGAAGETPAALPTLVRGVVDLAFREGGRWVIADWKTDAAAAARRDALVERYRAQVALYGGIWARISGEPVAERGLFFVASGDYVAF
jgi:ATP-dependent helicase/nuclease subunit A